jgi:hypothetical protein
MTERPIFVPSNQGTELVREVYLSVEWHSGFAQVQKERNIGALHAAASAAGFSPLLEISSKSRNKRGQHLSAFHMRVKTVRYGEIPLECAFQGSKVFERAGPFTDLYGAEARAAKRDPRLQQSGRLIGFNFQGISFPLEPKTAFYDWLYVTFLYPWREWGQKLHAYAGFTDIEFNPYRSINCQARSCALFVALAKRGLLEEAVKSPSNFARVLSGFDYCPQLRTQAVPLFHRTSW